MCAVASTNIRSTKISIAKIKDEPHVRALGRCSSRENACCNLMNRKESEKSLSSTTELSLLVIEFPFWVKRLFDVDFMRLTPADMRLPKGVMAMGASTS